MLCHAIPSPFSLGMFLDPCVGGWLKILGVDARGDVMVPKGTQIAEMQIALACPAVSVGGGEHGSWVMVDR